ncbi:uncharacterized protein LOC105287178 isoform X2 [Ooceraea biroi]|uniref:uncharacterized protein LOC105287178 isoform X2 n=1 Tax=Ooceraea biroi TaxID=2015173 RepID=UPI000F08B786|nr:uncharacterized protein LOC105287178 isoform X2 [Ooceraea biroi]
MVCFEDQYFNLNRSLLLVIGLWPYEQTNLARLRFIFFCVNLMSLIIFQLTVFVTSRCTPDVIITVLSVVFLVVIVKMQYILFSVNIKIKLLFCKIKQLLVQFRNIYGKLKDENEIAIAEKYNYKARRYTATFIMIAICSIFILIIAQTWMDICDIVLQINTSRSHNLILMTEYFVDQEKYYYVMLLHINITASIAVFILVAIGTMFITFLQYIYGLFKIASYRMEHSLDMDTLNNSMKDVNLVSKKIICAIVLQRQAMNLPKFLVNKLESMMFFLILFGVTSLSLNLFRAFQIASLGNNITEIIPHLIYAFAIISYMFVANYLGQNLTDYSKEVFFAAYNIQWYLTPIPIQKLILFLLQRGVIDFNVNVGRLFIPSLEGFTMLVKASVSYFTVIHSTR